MLRHIIPKGGLAPGQVRSLLKQLVPHQVLSKLRLGADAVLYPADFSEPEQALCERVSPFTMTSPERIVGLRNAVRSIVEQGIEGSMVECGVWRGGSMMVVALTLMELGDTSRDLYLFDTYSGMSVPTEQDRSIWGTLAKDLMSRAPKDGSQNIWCLASLEDVRANLATVGYPARKIHFIEGRVEDTIPNQAPPAIALLRLDTDWHDSTYHELVHLYPCLAPGGALIIDDYGAWRGARAATDEYFATLGTRPFLHRLDFTGRLAFKPK
jgi:hypothetical protein